MSVYVRPHRERWQGVSEHDDRLAVLFTTPAKFQAVRYAARVLDVSTSEIEVRE